MTDPLPAIRKEPEEIGASVKKLKRVLLQACPCHYYFLGGVMIIFRPFSIS